MYLYYFVFSVLSLQEQIEIAYKIPVDKQVLLASGGECLDSNAKVCTYSAGTDTNPIFLFSKCLGESPVQSEDGPNISDIGKRMICFHVFSPRMHSFSCFAYFVCLCCLY